VCCTGGSHSVNGKVCSRRIRPRSISYRLANGSGNSVAGGLAKQAKAGTGVNLLSDRDRVGWEARVFDGASKGRERRRSPKESANQMARWFGDETSSSLARITN
jgi:hypothetical protein